MTVIHVPGPSRKSMNPDRVANALLLAQVEHLQHAERRLPLRYRTTIYTHAIRTEGEAARYIREVTEAIHAAHANADADRSKGKRAPKRNPKPPKKRKSPGNASGKKSRKPK
ncbi:MAG TPA: hypothetical protein VH079_00490 [Terriglobales bacterium]|jgi:hypothetical protein|nr:hypothetical protein [Terriglobales bacterium]